MSQNSKARGLALSLALGGVVLVMALVGACSALASVPRLSQSGTPPDANAPTALPTGVTNGCLGQAFAQAQVQGLPTLSIAVASTEQERETGLMNRSSLDWDEGMLFVFQSASTDAFWMHDTLIPLSIAWTDQNGTIIDIQDMQPETDTLHAPPAPYWYALETNVGWFAANGVTAGNSLSLCFSGS